MNNRVAIVDSGVCNLDSVRRAVELCNAEPVLVTDGTGLAGVDRIILPGVGAFAEAMRNLTETELDRALDEEVLQRGIPFLGICLGMQLLATQGRENGPTKGLGWIEGEVRRLVPGCNDSRVPHMGWNEVRHDGSPTLFEGIPSGTDFYFVHSYHLQCEHHEDVAARTPYCGEFTSSVQHDLIFGVQFHPEKSQRHGLRLLRNFLSL